MEAVDWDVAKWNLARLVERAAAGEKIVINRDGKSIAMIVPSDVEAVVQVLTGKRQLGLLAGRVWMSPDFDDPLPPELQRAFDGEDP